MSDLPPTGEPRRSIFERLSDLLVRAPDDRQQLLAVLRQSHERDLLDADAMSMMEGVLQVSELTARDIMVPRARMDVIDVSRSLQAFIPQVIETAHSRFPVVDGDRDNVIGVLHAKDLLRIYAGMAEDVRALLRPAVFVPESMRLNVLLGDFRVNRNHLAIVVDEYGGVSGLITIEDVLEQIVGDIADEFDDAGSPDMIVPIDAGGTQRYRVRASTSLEAFDAYFDSSFANDVCDTVGGLVVTGFGRVPRRGERLERDGLRFEVLRADARHVQLLLVQRSSAPTPVPGIDSRSR